MIHLFEILDFRLDITRESNSHKQVLGEETNNAGNLNETETEPTGYTKNTIGTYLIQKPVGFFKIYNSVTSTNSHILTQRKNLQKL